jgi:hypothetical protein
MNAHPEGSKISRLQTLKQVEKSRGVTPPELLNAPKLSWQHDDCWIAYTSLKEHSYQELESYMRVTGNRLERWEVEAVMELAKYKDRELTSWRQA